jgi:hypothetical protein
MNNKLTTYSLTDAKLRRLLSWYREQKQKGKGDILPIHQQYLDLSLSQLRMVDISKMRYLEKIGWIKLLGAAHYKVLQAQPQTQTQTQTLLSNLNEPSPEIMFYHH